MKDSLANLLPAFELRDARATALPPRERPFGRRVYLGARA